MDDGMLTSYSAS